ncbi:MAG: hypothetical protein IJH32_10800 [Ruminococcus sp.]|nr:hypothetical protein [Ruminococcus sp.]
MNEYYPTNTGLPEGMEYDEQGNIFWYYEDKERHLYFRLEKERICYKYLPLTNPKKILGVNSSPYGKVIGLEFPDDELCRSFYDMKWIKEMRKKSCIKINSGGAYATIFVTSSQYDFVLNYLKIRCPDAKFK